MLHFQMSLSRHGLKTTLLGYHFRHPLRLRFHEYLLLRLWRFTNKTACTHRPMLVWLALREINKAKSQDLGPSTQKTHLANMVKKYGSACAAKPPNHS